MTTPTTRRHHPTRTTTPAAGAPRRVAVYVRRSTDDEHQPCSIDAQLAKLNSYIDSQPSWTLAATFSDDASGATTNRPGLQAALNAAHAGRYDVLLVYRVDRFSRRLTDMMALVEQLDTAGVAFCSATEHFDTSTPMGRMFYQARHPHHRQPAERPGPAQPLRQAVERAQHRPHPRQPRLPRRVHFRDVVTTDAHPALIDEEIFAAAQRLRDARGDKQTQRAGSDSDYHCTGLITCPRCGHKYVGTSARGKTRRYHYYTCFSRTRYGAAGCPAGRIDADDLDTAVLQAVAHTFTSRTQLLADVVARARQHHHDSHAHRRAELAAVEAELTTARAAIDRYLTAFENGTMNDTTCAPRIAALETKIIQLESRRGELVDLISAEPTAPSLDILDGLRRRIRDVIAAGTPAQRKELIEAMVAAIRIDGDAVYPIFRLPQDDGTPAGTSSTG